MKHSWKALLFGAVGLVLALLAEQMGAGKVPIPENWNWVLPVVIGLMNYFGRTLQDNTE